MIQIQKTRFIYNWRKRQSEYPTFKKILPEFLSKLTDFRIFLKSAGLNDISPNQWEVGYINHVPRGDLWDSPADWHNIFPGLFPPPVALDGLKLEAGAEEWRYEITPQRGRLHVSTQHGRSNETSNEVLVLQLTARGSFGIGDDAKGLEKGLQLGHDSLIPAFVSLSSTEALKYWGIR